MTKCTALPERFERHNGTELGDANYNDGATKSCKRVKAGLVVKAAMC
jgi:hypothetical protein